jgi:hypothetical protein
LTNIFISYTNLATDNAKEIFADMSVQGHKVCVDHEITGGQNWWDRILSEIRGCDILLFLVSPDSLRSLACSLERDYAKALGKIVLPVIIMEQWSVDELPAPSQTQALATGIVELMPT